MTRESNLGPFVLAAMALLPGRPLPAGGSGLSLIYLEHFDLRKETPSLVEPSGLALSSGSNGLWTISDEKRKIFNLRLDGGLRANKSFEIPVKGMEGIALDAAGEHLFTVDEDTNEIIQIHIADRKVVARRRLADMAGFGPLSRSFRRGGASKGLEGIAWNERTNTLFVVKEGLPGLIVEISADLATILAYRLLNEDNGFRDDDVSGDEMDFSGICHDRSRDKFWIVSDRCRRLFLYDWKDDRVTHSLALGYEKNGKHHEIEKAEGVAFDPEANRLYIVSDSEARLYVFELRE